MSEAFPKAYDPKTVEKQLYDFWEKQGVLTADVDSDKPTFCIMMPPPNVTGVLHMGHALTMTIEDIITRRKRMLGFNTLWLPGTDHAGIATQMVVERYLLREHKVSRHDLGREKFLEKVWEWKEQSQGTILGQLRQIGSSCDWTRLRFTLDESMCRAVRECFVRLYEEGLIFRDHAITNWCPRCHTALSDLEVKFKESKGKLWHIRYVLKDDPKKYVIVATTRPETLLGDTAVAIHPGDERFKAFFGKTVIVPLVNREVPVIEDAYVDKEFGTGALKITPAHDPNDYVIGKKHGLEMIAIMDENARLNEKAGPYQGLSREDGRKKVLVDLQAQGLLESDEEYMHNVGHCDRCATAVEPWLSAQWYVNAEELAKAAIEVVEKKEIRIVPEEWEKTYFEWMRNIRPWCISRQLWWGHRIPVWYCESCNEPIVDRETPKKCTKCGETKLRQDEDVLDTWFSSGLFPISTLGWPDKSADLAKFYPTDVMETGFDILFFWVARMIMMCHKMTGEIPFHTIYLHPMVRDAAGKKMSKTKGNVKDPLEIIDKVGADALRFTLTSMAVHGRDVLLSDSRIEGYRNFVNKIWNASRFVMLHFEDVTQENRDLDNEINQWIWSRLNQVKAEMNKALDEYRFYEAANLIYHFIWSEYCDWFIEIMKGPGELESRKEKKESTAIQVLEESLRLLHPIMPFVTEEIWQKLPLKEEKDCIVVTSYPQPDKALDNPKVEKRVGRVISIVESVRSKRGDNNLAPDAVIGLRLNAQPEVLEAIKPFKELIQKLVRSKEIEFSSEGVGDPKTVILVALDDVEVSIPRGDLIDLEKAMAKTQQELEQSQGELKRAQAKLKNEKFVKGAPEKVVQGVQERAAVLEKKVGSLTQYLKELTE